MREREREREGERESEQFIILFLLGHVGPSFLLLVG